MLETIGAIILNEKGELLVQDHIDIGGLTVPSGKMEPGEHPTVALKREIREELGVGINYIHKPVFAWTSNIESLGLVHHILFAITLDGEPKNMEPKKHRSLDWRSLDYLENTTEYKSHYLVKVINLLKQGKYHV